MAVQNQQMSTYYEQKYSRTTNLVIPSQRNQRSHIQQTHKGPKEITPPAPPIIAILSRDEVHHRILRNGLLRPMLR